MKTAEERFWEKVRKAEGEACWEWTASLFVNSGYGCFCYDRRLQGAHRVSWQMVHGPIPDGLWVLHKCDNPKCVRPDHLFLGTPMDNVRDMVAKGRGVSPTGDAHWFRQKIGAQRGANNFNAKLDEGAVFAIKAGLAAGDPVDLVAHLYGVSGPAISLILTGKNWQHVPWPEGACFSVDCDTAKRSRGIRAANMDRYDANCAGCGRARDGLRVRCAECWSTRRRASKTANARLQREQARKRAA